MLTAQNLVYGILVGGLYGLAAVGLSLVFGVTKFLNVAHGELLMLGGYAGLWFFSKGVDPFLSLPAVAVCLVLFGLFLYWLLFYRMVKLTESDKIKNTLLVGFGVSLILQNLARLFFTADDRGITTSYAGQALFTILGVRFPIVRVASFAIALICLVALHLFLRRTYLGKAIRATVQDWEAATVMGINIQRVYLLAFVIGAGLAGVAGALVAVGWSIQPTMGLDWTLIALVVMVLGGLGSILGTFVGGLVLGVTQSLTNIWPGGEYREIVALLLFLVVLVLRPQGLFGSKEG